jgi:hypothetical protein
MSKEMAWFVDESRVVEQLPYALRCWLALERFHLHKAHIFQNLSRDPGFDLRHLPQHCQPFWLPCYWVPREHLFVYESKHERRGFQPFCAGGSPTGEVLFPIHPSVVEDFWLFLKKSGARDVRDDGLRLWALPTSSTRTLLVWPDGAGDQAVFVKTSLHSDILGDRRITRIRAGRSVGLNRLIEAERVRLPSKWRVLPEVLGLSTRHSLDSGALIRLVPEEIKDGRVLVAPLFSLLGGDCPRRPLLFSLLERADMEAVRFVDELLCAPFATLWVELTFHHGLILEAHGQDLLLGLSSEGIPTGDFYYRDLEGLQVDWELRRYKGRQEPDLPNRWAWREAYGTLGYRFCDFVWYKWEISLFNYLRMVLGEVELSLREWYDRGLVRGPKCGEGELTMLFSRHLFGALEQTLNHALGTPYDVLASLNRFLIDLMRCRKEVLHGDH